MQIGDVARQSGISRDTLRYYEKTGLIQSVARQDNGYRDFPTEVVGRLAFIKKMQSLGFTLGGVRTLLDIVDQRKPTCRAVSPHIKKKFRELDMQIAALMHIRDELRTFFAECRELPAGRVCVPIARLVPK
jgi:DNA-binding transcriptional MerR regulator